MGSEGRGRLDLDLQRCCNAPLPRCSRPSSRALPGRRSPGAGRIVSTTLQRNGASRARKQRVVCRRSRHTATMLCWWTALCSCEPAVRPGPFARRGQSYSCSVAARGPLGPSGCVGSAEVRQNTSETAKTSREPCCFPGQRPAIAHHTHLAPRARSIQCITAHNCERRISLERFVRKESCLSACFGLCFGSARLADTRAPRSRGRSVVHTIFPRPGGRRPGRARLDGREQRGRCVLLLLDLRDRPTPNPPKHAPAAHVHRPCGGGRACAGPNDDRPGRGRGGGAAWAEREVSCCGCALQSSRPLSQTSNRGRARAEVGC